MPASHPAVFPRLPVTHSARVAIFSFPLTWSFLADFPDPKELERPQVARSPITTPPEPIQPPIQPMTHASREAEAPREGSDRWEMVIPKMVRAPQGNPSSATVREPALPKAIVELPPPSGIASSPLFRSVGKPASFSKFRPALVSLLVLL